MEENGNDIFSVFGCVSAVELLGACFSHDYGIDAFEVRGVGHKRKVDLAAIGVGSVHARAQVVLMCCVS